MRHNSLFSGTFESEILQDNRQCFLKYSINRNRIGIPFWTDKKQNISGLREALDPLHITPYTNCPIALCDLLLLFNYAPYRDVHRE